MKTDWIANTKGGVGKTTLAIFLRNAFAAGGEPRRLIDADAKAKLKNFFGEATSLGVGASAADVRANPSLAVSYWDKLADLVLEGDSLVDLGANVDRSVWEWARKSDIGGEFADAGVELTVWIPMTAEPEAVSGAHDVVKAVGEIFPSARRVVVLNLAAGDFESYAHVPEFKAMVTAAKKGELTMVTFPRCTSEAWVDFERERTDWLRVIEMEPAAVQEKFRLSRREAARAVADLSEWVKAVYTSFGSALPAAR